MNQLSTTDFTKFIQVKKSQALTDSISVAEAFGKEHKNVLRAIENIECSEEFSRLNFAPTTIVIRGKESPSFLMTRDGFTFLVMGFTGKKAAAFKEQFILAFNTMEKQIARKNNVDWIEARKNSKFQRKELSDALKEFCVYAKNQGSNDPEFYFMNVSRMTNKYLEIIKDKTNSKPTRDFLDCAHLTIVSNAESIAEEAFYDGMEQGMFYKDIYQHAKKKVEAFASAVMPAFRQKQARIAAKSVLKIAGA